MREKHFIALAGLAIAGFVLLLLYSFFQLSQIQRSLGEDEGENLLWMLTQSEKETRRLHQTLTDMELGRADREDVLFRRDMLHSRMALLSERPQRTYLEKLGVARDVAVAIGAFAGISPQLADISATDGADLPAIRAALLQQADRLGRLANRSMVTKREAQARKRDRHRKTMYIIMAAFSGLLVTGAALSWMLVRSMQDAWRFGRELQRHRDQLEATVADRTAELRAALATEREAKEAYRSFVTMVSHQFRTPLAIIGMVAQRLELRAQEFSATEITRKTGRIRNATQRLENLVANVTDAMRVDEGHLTLNRARHDLNDILRNATRTQSELTPRRSLHLTLEEAPLNCWCDAILIEEVTANLLANAIKYSPDETAIDIRSGRESGFVHCSIRDRGIGIPAREQSRIFTRFYRGTNVTSHVGVGLGLNLSRSIIELHGGHIHFDSQPGQGSIFTFCLPEDRPGVYDER